MEKALTWKWMAHGLRQGNSHQIDWFDASEVSKDLTNLLIELKEEYEQDLKKNEGYKISTQAQEESKEKIALISYIHERLFGDEIDREQ